MLNKIIIFLLLPIVCFSEELQLKNLMQTGHAGEFMVAQHMKNYTLWHVKEVKDGHLLLEEITVPMQRLKLPEGGWQGWINKGAPNHVGWVMYTIDLNQGQVTGIFSLRSCTWLSENLANGFLGTFLNIKLTPVEERDRRKLRDGSLWNPPLFYHGEEMEGEFDQYITRWPADGSELSNKRVEIYLLHSENYPAFFPYWLQLCGSFGKLALRIVDSGKQLSTPTTPMWKVSITP